MIFGIPFIEIVGYLASVLIALSLTMSSILKLRWINLVGAALFSVYGFIIGALPVGLLNGFIAVVNMYYLIRLSSQKEHFKLFQVKGNDRLLKEFLQYHKKEIQQLAPDFDFQVPESGHHFLLLRNMDIAGVFIGRPSDPKTLRIALDFVSPKYRDFKLGNFIYSKDSAMFRNEPIEEVVGKARTKAYRTYFERMGFKKKEEKDQETLYHLTF